MTLEQYITLQQRRLKKFELLELRRQNAGYVPMSVDEEEWEAEFGQFLSEEFARQDDTCEK